MATTTTVAYVAATTVPTLYRVFELKVDIKYCSPIPPIPTITKLYGSVLVYILGPPSIVIVT